MKALKHKIIYNHFIKQAQNNFRIFSRLIAMEINQDYDFNQNWVHCVQDTLQEVVYSNETHRVAFNLPPRTGKTSLITLYGACWLLARNPRHKILIVTSSNAFRADMHAIIKLIFNSNVFQKIFPDFEITKNNETTTQTSRGGFIRRSVSGSNAIGQGYHFMFFDDFFNPNNILSDAESISASRHLRNFLTRKEHNPKTKIFIIEQRLGFEDATGILTANWKMGNLPYKHIIIPFYIEEEFAIGKYVFPVNTYIDKRFNDITKQEILTDLNFDESRYQTLYQQRPTASEGAVIKLTENNYYNPEYLSEMTFDYILIGVDTAVKANVNSDYTAMVCMGMKGKRFYVLNAERVKMDYINMVNAFTSFYDRMKQEYKYITSIIIEETSNGNALISHLQHGMLKSSSSGKTIYTQVLGHKPLASKVERFRACQGVFIENFKIPEFAHWLPNYKSELEAFPNGAHDDFVDATTMIINEVLK